MGSGNLGIGYCYDSRVKKIHQELLSREAANFVVGAGVGLVIIFGGIGTMTAGKALPGLRIAGEQVGGKSEEEIRQALAKRLENYSPTLEYGESELALPEEVWRAEVEETAKEAVGRGKSDLMTGWRVLRGEVEMGLVVRVEEQPWQEFISEVRMMGEIAGERARMELAGRRIVVVNGRDEIRVDEEKLREEVELGLRRLTKAPIRIDTEEIRWTLDEEELGELRAVGEAVVGKRLVVRVDEAEATLADKEIVRLISTAPASLGEPEAEKVRGYAAGLAERYNRKPQDARLAFVGGKVEEFAPARDGITIIEGEAGNKIEDGIWALLRGGVEEEVVEVEVERTPPKITTEEVNNLGIVERIGKGESYYAHSIPNRVYNVGLASSRVNGALVGPGEEFSFNQIVGEISAATGYRTAYVIANGRTELGDGGGVCQVSTTIFRAALNAGLPITERYAHAYRVGYYEQNAKPGLDATIYSPSKDLKFVNDTPGHILIQAIVDEPKRQLTFELYGTRDGRVSLLSPVRVWGETPPPPDLYQDDPTLPLGEVKQVDWAAWGAKTSFDYRVERDGETIFSKTFNSSFRPWQNVYLRGTGQ